MQRSPKIQLVHNELQNVDKKKVMELVEAVNLTPREKDIVIKTELEGYSVSDIEDLYNIAFTTVVKAKKKAMLKIYQYLTIS